MHEFDVVLVEFSFGEAFAMYFGATASNVFKFVQKSTKKLVKLL